MKGAQSGAAAHNRAARGDDDGYIMVGDCEPLMKSGIRPGDEAEVDMKIDIPSLNHAGSFVV